MVVIVFANARTLSTLILISETFSIRSSSLYTFKATKQMHIWASIRLRAKWDMGRISIFDLAMRLKKLSNIGIVHQAGISHHNEVFQTVFAYKLVYRRQHRVTFIFVALMDAIGKRIAAQANKQAEYDLRITVTPLFRKAGLAQFVLIIRFKVKCSDIIEVTKSEQNSKLYPYLYKII